MYDCPIRYGLDGVQTVTYVCHGLDGHPGQSRIGRPNRDWDWTVALACHGLDVQSVTWIEHFLKPSNPSHGLDVQSVTWIGRPIRDNPGRSSNPSHGLDVQSVTGLDDRPIRDVPMSRFGHRPIRSGLDNRK